MLHDVRCLCQTMKRRAAKINGRRLATRPLAHNSIEADPIPAKDAKTVLEIPNRGLPLLPKPLPCFCKEHPQVRPPSAIDDPGRRPALASHSLK